MIMKELNKIQIEQVNKLLGYYKTFFICNSCGTVYGSDMKQKKEILCPVCEIKSEKDKNGNKARN